MFISNAYAQTAATTSPDGLAGLLANPMIIFPVMFAVMWIFMIRPQQKRAKEQAAMINALSKGDEVVAASGILGKITKVTDAYVTLEIAEGTEVIVQKAAVTMLLPKGTIKSL